VRTGDDVVLIDTGVGPVVTGIFKGGKLLAEMAAAGVRPEEITKVFITHLHLDHCGTAAVEQAGAMRVTFPNASYHWTSADQAYFAAQPAVCSAPRSGLRWTAPGTCTSVMPPRVS